MKDEIKSLCEPYEELANAIIIKACQDYRKARKRLKKHPLNEKAKTRIREIESFFNSKWYRVLTSIPAEAILERLRKEK